MSLKEIVAGVEKDVGLFSIHDKTIENGNTYTIPFAKKPAAQLIAALAGSKDPNLLLSTANPALKNTDNVDVTLQGFTDKTANKQLTLSGKRLDRLLKSGKVYVNTHIFPTGLYQRVIQEKLASKKEDLPSETNGIHLENIAAGGICIAQEIDLLISPMMSSHKRAHTTVREGKIEENDPALLLLSSPHLNFNSTLGKHLDTDTQARFIEGLFRNLFDATQKEGRKYIAMPAAGLGKHGGQAEMYFAALMKVAKEFPELNIIYNPGDHEKAFDKALKKANLTNIAKTTKNIIFMADRLTQLGNPCALYIPADSEVMYGLKDIGGHWKSIETEPHHSMHVSDLLFVSKKNETSQTYIGALSTAPLNSFGLNSVTYATVLERDLDAKLSRRNSNTDGVHAGSRTDLSLPSEEEKAKKNPSGAPVIQHASVKTPPQSTETHIPPVLVETQKKTTDLHDTQTTPIPGSPKKNTQPTPSEHTDPLTPVVKEQPPQLPLDQAKPVNITCSLGKNGMFPPAPTKPIQTYEPKSDESSLSQEQIDEINKAIDCLTGEIQSCWPYPNKDVKQIKVDALQAVITNALTMSIRDAIKAAKNEYPRATDGRISTRTADLFAKLENSPENIPMRHF